MEQLDVDSALPCVGMDHEDATHGSLNISDVIEVLRTTDPEYVGATSDMYSAAAAGGVDAAGAAAGGSMDDARKRLAYVKLLEQPASKALRFRYECEGRSAGSIPGVNSTPENKTFPSIQIVGYKGRAVVVVSCVTRDPPYRPHPHNLVGKEGCKKGVCTMELNNESMSVTFSNLGIQCVKKKDIEEALRVREEIRVDPYRTGFAHRNQPTSIDLNAVRLCFQVFLEGSVKGKFTFQLNPIVSDPIFDKKAMSDLVICKLSDCSCSVAGGKEIILLCEKVAKEDIQVRFYEERGGHVVWESYGDFQPTQVHKQVAISFRSPRYSSLEVDAPVKVNIQLRRPSDGATSEPLPFEFLPLDSDPAILKRKRQKLGSDTRQFQDLDNLSRPVLHPSQPQQQQQQQQAGYAMSPSPDPSQAHHLLSVVKREPADPPYMYLGGDGNKYGPHRMMNATPSPQPQASPLSTAGHSPSPMAMGCMTNAHTFGGGNVYDYAACGQEFLGPGNQELQQPAVGPSAFLSVMVNNLQRNTDSAAAHNTDKLNVGNFGVPLGPVLSEFHRTQMTNHALGAMGLPMHNHADMSNADQTMAETNSILDLDSHQCCSLGQFDSAEFANLGLGLFDANLSENLSINLTLSDSKPI